MVWRAALLVLVGFVEREKKRAQKMEICGQEEEITNKYVATAVKRTLVGLKPLALLSAGLSRTRWWWRL